MTIQTPRQMIFRAKCDPDNWCIGFSYTDQDGETTERIVSPTRYSRDGKSVRALCMAREEARWFRIDQMKDVRLVPSSDVLMGDWDGD